MFSVYNDYDEKAKGRILLNIFTLYSTVAQPCLIAINITQDQSAEYTMTKKREKIREI